MALAALPNDTVTIWWITLAIGLILAVAVVLLLQSLIKEVESLRDAVDRLWNTAGTVARNTGQSWMIGAAADSVIDLRDEALRHDALLASVLAGQPAGPSPTKGRRGWS
ncbi:MAG: hypothetical protein DLM59_02685 [Pseudonocardiales bacterium]|nr:MAG: hypothetical protein DLM59_02685 [Pseudonocardiales bacterium]